MARKLTPEEAATLTNGRRAPWKQWADGERWLINVTTDLAAPTTVQRAASTAATWARRNGYAFYYEYRSSTELVVKFYTDDKHDGQPTSWPTYREFQNFLDTHLEVTDDLTDELTFSELWEAWNDHRTTHTLIAHNPAPRALRALRKGLEHWVTDNGHNEKLIMTAVGRAATATMYGAKLAATTPPSALPLATPEPSPRPAMPSVKLPPSPFGSNQPDEAPPAPATPAPTIDWPTLNALATTIDQLDDNEQDTTP